MSSKNNSVKIIVPKSKDGNKVVIQISDELSIYTIENIKSEINDTIIKYEYIEFDLIQVKNMDLTFVQLIESVKKTGKKVDIKIELSPENQNLFEITDLAKILYV